VRVVGEKINKYRINRNHCQQEEELDWSLCPSQTKATENLIEGRMKEKKLEGEGGGHAR